ncbi:MAG: hypothetical protein QOD75_2978 [Blastocatellia bacterium]|jgi:predicted DCC family thiol-disulfide oxidoreductase YuxK|nr:hypothetical protein [Blastocatellia bacterium]
MAAKSSELDLSAFPAGTVSEYSTLVCLACIFKIFTKQLGLAPRAAYSEIKRYAPSTDELTAPNAVRPFFDSEEKNPHCPYCNAAKRWLARLDTYRIEGGKTTDAPRRALIKRLPQKDDQFLTLETKSDTRAIFFEWLDTLGQTFDFADEAWLIEAARIFLVRRHPKENWQEAFANLRALRRSSRLSEGWERDGARLFLSPALYYEVLLIQYLVSRSHAHGGRTMEGRLTLMDLLRRLRHGGYLDTLGIKVQDPGELFEKLVAHLAGDELAKPLTANPVAKVAAKKKAIKASGAAKGKRGAVRVPAVSEDEPTSEPVKLHFIVDRRDFLQKVKTVYAHYAG